MKYLIFSLPIIILLSLLSCEEESVKSDNRNYERVLNQLMDVVDLRSTCVPYNDFHDLYIAVSIGTDLHASKSKGYYCPLNDCLVYNEFHELYSSELLSRTTATEMEMFEECSSFFANQINSDLFHKSMSSVELYVDNLLISLSNDDFISGQEADLIDKFFNEVFNSDLNDVDFSYYLNQIELIDVDSKTMGQMSSNLFAVTPLVLEERMTLLMDWYDGSSPDDPEELIGYSLLAATRFFIGFGFGVYDKGQDDPAAGNCGLRNGFRAVAYGI